MKAYALLLLLASSAKALRPQPQLRPHAASSLPPARAPTLVAAAAAATEEPAAGSSLTSSTINLVKTIVGAGVLGLPFGISSFSSSRAAMLPALAILAAITAVSAYCFAMVGRVCEATGSDTWAEAWTATVGASSAWVPSCFVACLCFSASLQYTMVIGDSFSAIFAAAALPAPLAPLASRTGAIAAVTALGTLPLSLLPNLEMLKYTSSLGIAGLLYTAAFMLARISAYAPSAALTAAVAPALRPRFDAAPFRLAALLQPKVCVLLSILATSFCAHFLSPQFFRELAPAPAPAPAPSPPAGGATKPPASKLRRFGVLTAGGFGLSGLLSAAVMAAGFLTFGGAADGYILNNYAATDRLAQLARLAIGGSIVTTYPLLHQGLRNTLLEALAQRGKAPPRQAVSLATIGLITALGMVLTDLGTVAAVSGALVSTSLVYVLPSLMFGQMLAARAKAGAAPPLLRLELLGSRVVTALGLAMTVVGVMAAF